MDSNNHFYDPYTSFRSETKIWLKMFATYDKFERNTSFNGLSICNESVQHIEKPIGRTTAFHQSFKITLQCSIAAKAANTGLKILTFYGEMIWNL